MEADVMELRHRESLTQEEYDAVQKMRRERKEAFDKKWDKDRKRTFADVLPEYLDEARQFQKTFGAYFPFLLEDEHAVIILHQKMRDGIFGNPTETIRKSKFETDLKRLRKAIQTIADHPTAYWQRMPGRSDFSDDVSRGAYEIFDLVLAVEAMAPRYGNPALSQIMDRYEEWAREAVKHVPERRNIKWEAVHAVSRLRWYWESWAEIPAPRRALKEESPFADYLRDAFEFFKIQGDPISAFKRWAILVDKQESLL
jgi:hypothetical protein